MKKQFWFLAIFMAVALMLTGCSYDFEKGYEKLEEKAYDSTISYDSFMNAYKSYCEKLEKEMDKLEQKFYQGEKIDYERADMVSGYISSIRGDFTNDLINKAKNNSTKSEKEAAVEIYDLTSWSGPKCEIVNNGKSIVTFYYNPGDTVISYSTINQNLQSYIERYGLTLTDLKYSNRSNEITSSGVDVISPWGMKLEASFEKKMTLNGYGIFTENECDEYTMKIGETFIFPEPVNSYFEEGYFVGWTDGTYLYKAGDSLIVDVDTKTEYESLYVGIDFVSSHSYDNYNNDGLFSAGENGWLDLTLYNFGNYKISSMNVNIESETEGVTVINGNKDFGGIQPGCYTNLSNTSHYDGYTYERGYTTKSDIYTNFFSLEISRNIPDGTKAALKITVKDEAGHTWSWPITFTVNTINLELNLIGYKFTDDGNGNGDDTLNIGEKGYIDACFFNTSNDSYYGVTTQLECSTPGVAITKSKSSSYDYSPKQYRSVGGDYDSNVDKISYFYKKDAYFAVSLPKSIEEGTVLEFAFVVTDKLGNTKEFPFEVVAKKNEMDFSLEGYSFMNQNGLGNGDNVMNIGETGYLDVTICNNSDKKAKGITATLECENEGVTITKSTSPTFDYDAKQYRTIGGRKGTDSSLGYFYSLDNCFKIALSPTLEDGTVLKFKIVLTDTVGNKTEHPFSVTVEKADCKLSLFGYSFSDNNNNNNKLEIGEEGNLDVCFYNSGIESAIIKAIELESETDGVIVTKSSGNTNTYKAGKYSTLSAPSYDSPQYFRYKGDSFFSVRIAGDVHEGTEVRLKVKVTDYLGIVSEYPIVFSAEKQELGVDLGIGYAEKKDYELIYQGEDLAFSTILTNKSSSSIVHTTVTMSTDSEYVTPSSLTYDYATAIASGKSSTKKWLPDENLTFSISKSAPIGTEITFDILVSDMTGKTKEFKFTRAVGPSSFSPVIYEPVYNAYDVQGGTGLAAGSYVYLDVIIANIGPYGKKTINGKTVYPGEGTNVSIKVVPNSPELTVLKDSCSIGTLSSGYYSVASRGENQSKLGVNDYSLSKIKEKYTNTNNGFEFKISDSAVTGEKYSFTIQVLENGKVVKEYESFLELN